LVTALWQLKILQRVLAGIAVPQSSWTAQVLIVSPRENADGLRGWYAQLAGPRVEWANEGRKQRASGLAPAAV
jgi:hypothetical protein